jgi:hypothetical protein
VQEDEVVPDFGGALVVGGFFFLVYVGGLDEVLAVLICIVAGTGMVWRAGSGEEHNGSNQRSRNKTVHLGNFALKIGIFWIGGIWRIVRHWRRQGYKTGVLTKKTAGWQMRMPESSHGE